MLKKLIPKKIRNKRLRESVAYNASSTIAGSGGGGSGGGGLPYSLNDAGEYVIDNTINVEGSGFFKGDVISKGIGAVKFAANDGGGASNLNDLTDVTLTNPQEGDMLRFDGKQWRNINEITLKLGRYRT